MATYTLHRLINGDHSIIEYYQNASRIWSDIKHGNGYISVGALAQELADRQSQFESECGGKQLGREIMATVGIGQFYTLEVGFDAFQEEVIKVYEAFDRSYCSIEVKLWVNKIAKILHLEGVTEIEI